MRTYPNLQITEAFHPLSHHANDPSKIERLTAIQKYHTQVFAKFIDKLTKTQDGDGNLLDHSIILYGSNMSNSDLHNNDPLPKAVLGRAMADQGRPAPEVPAGHAAREPAAHAVSSRASPGGGRSATATASLRRSKP